MWPGMVQAIEYGGYGISPTAKLASIHTDDLILFNARIARMKAVFTIKDNIVFKYEFENSQGSTKDDKFVSNCLANVSPALN